MKREYQIKRLTRYEKILLINTVGDNMQWFFIKGDRIWIFYAIGLVKTQILK
jgi:hypothetical protein